MYLQPEPKTVYINISWVLRSQKLGFGPTLFQNRIYQELSVEKGLLIKAEKVKRENGNIPFV